MRNLLILLFFISRFASAQNIENTKAFHIAIGIEIILYSTTMYSLNQLWYKDYPKSNFHWINDNSKWLQMDKIGHDTNAYNISMFANELMMYSGVSKKKSLW